MKNAFLVWKLIIKAILHKVAFFICKKNKTRL